jgi:hypothetical protein
VPVAIGFLLDPTYGVKGWAAFVAFGFAYLSASGVP